MLNKGLIYINKYWLITFIPISVVLHNEYTLFFVYYYNYIN